jgi:hypothetical protein
MIIPAFRRLRQAGSKSETLSQTQTTHKKTSYDIHKCFSSTF